MANVTLSCSIVISATPVQVFAAMTDWPRQNEWMVGTTVTAVKHNGQDVGGSIAARTALGPLGFTDPMTITEWQPPFRCAVVHTGGVVKGTGLFLVEAEGDQSRFTWSEVIVLPFGRLGHFGWKLAKPVACFGLSWSLRRFKRWTEQQ